jgi:hypothetical protein
MQSIPPFSLPGQWFKGCLHTHTTQSDGTRHPAEVMAWYAGNGYDFLSLTDHYRVTDPFDFGRPPLLTIPGTEITALRGQVEYHIVALGIHDLPIAPRRDPQATIDAVNAAGGVCFVAHPYWHDLQLEDLLPLQGHIGIEIFNAGCWLEIQKGHALVHWDALLRRGQHPYGLAVDDAHFRDPDYGYGWIMLRSERLDVSSVLKALSQGHFYASMGPEIYDVQVNGRQVTVRCSPAYSVYLVGDYYNCPNAAHVWDKRQRDRLLSQQTGANMCEEPITEFTFQLSPNQRYLRVEVVDMDGLSAWSNPYFL